MHKKILIKAIAASLIIIGSVAQLVGCAQQPVQYVTKSLWKPERPVLPALTEADVQCLSKEAFFKLVNRDRLRREYAEELEVIIESTQSEE
ncbi:MAG: hypothetical protein JKY50_09455 [Oleispira sp.]|nr:hypothetical protein [Oleispira sp.]